MDGATIHVCIGHMFWVPARGLIAYQNGGRRILWSFVGVVLLLLLVLLTLPRYPGIVGRLHIEHMTVRMM